MQWNVHKNLQDKGYICWKYVFQLPLTEYNNHGSLHRNLYILFCCITVHAICQLKTYQYHFLFSMHHVTALRKNNFSIYTISWYFYICCALLSTINAIACLYSDIIIHYNTYCIMPFKFWHQVPIFYIWSIAQKHIILNIIFYIQNIII